MILQMMNIICPRIGIAALVIGLLLFANASGHAQQPDVETLSKALTKSLGKETSYGMPRLLGIKKELRQGKKTLIIAVSANRSPTHIGVRMGAFADALRVFKILQSWDWPDKVEQVMFGGYIKVTGKAVDRVQPVFMCQISSDKIRNGDWSSVEPKDVPERVDAIRFFDTGR